MSESPIDGVLISVIIPVYNGAPFLVEAVDSVLQQPYEPLEVIIVDDGSTDDTARIAADCAAHNTGKIRYVWQPNQGPAAARNHGLALATGALIAFQDADDIWTPDKLERQLAILDADPNIDIVVGWVRCFRSAVPPPGLPAAGELSAPQPRLSMQCALCRRDVFTKVGLLDEMLRYGEDINWFLRAREQGVGIRIHEDVVLLYRRHEGNVTNDRRLQDRGMLLAISKLLAHRGPSSHDKR